MRTKFIVAVLLGCLAATATPAHASTFGEAILGKGGVLEGKYRKGNLIRAYAWSRDGSPQRALQAAMVKIAEMANDKGFFRIGVTKVSDCGTLKMSSVTVGHSCRVIAQMVGPDEVAKPEGQTPVVYFAVSELMVGNIRPQTQKSLVTIPW